MNGITMLILLASYLQAQGKELEVDSSANRQLAVDKLVDKLANKLVNRALRTVSFQPAAVDNTTLGKPFAKQSAPVLRPPCRASAAALAAATAGAVETVTIFTFTATAAAALAKSG
jgi:hypothetical protein